MQPPREPRKRIAYEHVTAVGLVVLTVASIVITVVLAIRRNDRLPFMVAVSLLLVFLTAVNGLRVRLAFRSLQRNLHLIRRRSASKGTILKFPKRPGPGQPPDTQNAKEPEDP